MPHSAAWPSHQWRRRGAMPTRYEHSTTRDGSTASGPGDLDRARSGRTDPKCLGLLRGLRGRDRWTHHRALAWPRDRRPRDYSRGGAAIRRAESGRIAPLGAVRLLPPNGMAHLRRLHVRSRLRANRARAPDCTGLGAPARTDDPGVGLRCRAGRLRAGAVHALQHRSKRRDDLPDYQEHSRPVRLLSRRRPPPDRRLSHVDRLRGDGHHELHVPDRERGEPLRRIVDQRYDRHAHWMERVGRRFLPRRTRALPDAAGSRVCDLPAIAESQSGCARMGAPGACLSRYDHAESACFSPITTSSQASPPMPRRYYRPSLSRARRCQGCVSDRSRWRSAIPWV